MKVITTAQNSLPGKKGNYMLKQFTLTAILATSLLVYGLTAPEEGSVGNVGHGTPAAPSGHGNSGGPISHGNPAAPSVGHGYYSAPAGYGFRSSPMMPSRPDFRGPMGPGQQGFQHGPRPGFPPSRMRPPMRPPYFPGPYPITGPNYPAPFYSPYYGPQYWFWYPAPLPTYVYYDYPDYYDYPPDYYPYYDNGYNGYYSQGYSNGNSYDNDGSAGQYQEQSDTNTQENSLADNQDPKKLQQQSEAWVVEQLGLQGNQKTQFLAHLRKLQSMRKIFMMTRQTLTEELDELQKDNASQEEMSAKIQEIQDLDTKFQGDEKAALSMLMNGLTVSQKAKYYSLKSQLAPAQDQKRTRTNQP